MVGNNPWPASGQPHGSGISHSNYPFGYKLDGKPRPSFDNYIDYSDGAPNDERPFLGARILGGRPCPRDGFETRRKILVFPGDTVRVSAYIHNNGPASHNGGGRGPAVARDTRIGVELPGEPARELQVSAWLFARNAVPLEHDLNLHTISDNISIRSRDGQPIEVSYVPDSARLLVSRQSLNESYDNYRAWLFTQAEAQWLLSVDANSLRGRAELEPHAGISVGSDGSFKVARSVGTSQQSELPWFGCNTYHGYVDFSLLVRRAPSLLDG